MKKYLATAKINGELKSVEVVAEHMLWAVSKACSALECTSEKIISINCISGMED